MTSLQPHLAAPPSSSSTTPVQADEVLLHFCFPSGERSSANFKLSQGGFDVYAKAYEAGGKHEPTPMTLHGPTGSLAPMSLLLDEKSWALSLFEAGLRPGNAYDVNCSRTSTFPSISSPSLVENEVALLFHLPDCKHVVEIFKTSHGGFDVYAKARALGEQKDPVSMRLSGPRDMESRSAVITSQCQLIKDIDDQAWGHSLAQLGLRCGLCYDVSVGWRQNGQLVLPPGMLRVQPTPAVAVPQSPIVQGTPLPQPTMTNQALMTQSHYTVGQIVPGKVERFEIA